MFRWANCFQQVTHNEEGWDAMYCTEVTTISFLSLVNAGLFGFLLVVDVNQQRQKDDKWLLNYLGRSKSWILVIGVVMDLVQFVRNFLQPEFLSFPVFNGTLYLFNFCTWVMYVLVFWYYTKQSVSLLGSETIRKWQVTIMLITIAACVLYVAYGVWYFVKMVVQKNGNGY